jgi:hypothetical protein
MSDLLNSASLVLIPSGYAEDKVYSAVPTDGSGDMSFTRASNGTRVNSAGLVEVVSWNLALQSEDFTNAEWVLVGSSVSSNAIVAPNGTTTADKLVEDTSTGTHITLQINGNRNVSSIYSFSVYAKAGERTKINLFNNGNGAGNANFDLVNGTATLIAGEFATIENVGNGWYRCNVGMQENSTVGSFNYHIRLLDASGNDSYTGNGTSGAYIWGAQINLGTLKPYFPTTDRLNVPRLTYQNGGGGCPSLLLEKQSTNYFTYSEQFDNADWTKLNTTVSANSTTSPDGTQNADTLTPTTTNGVHRIQQDKATVSQVFTQSIFAKANGYNFIAVENGGEIAYFNISTGVVGTVSAGTASIQNMGNGWYRCIFTATAVNTKSYFYVANADNSISFAGDATSGIFVWGCQFESGSYATSYISTTSASATRVADECKKSGIGALIGGTSGTVFFDIKTNPTLSSANYKQFCYYINSAASQSYMFLDGVNKIQTNVNWGNLLYNTAFQPNTRYKVALVFAPNDFALYINGVSVATASSGTPNNNVDIQIGQFNGTEMCEFVFNQYTHFPSRLTNAELASLTTI